MSLFKSTSVPEQKEYAAMARATSISAFIVA
jgi:hypothetical protein